MVLVIRVKGPSRDCVLPFNIGASYSLEKLISADFTTSAALTSPMVTNLLKGQMYVPVCRGFNDCGAPVAVITLLLKVARAPFGASDTTLFNSHVIFKLDIQNKTLLFSTVKGTSNADAKEIGPGEKPGSVGQGGPQIPSMFAVWSRPTISNDQNARPATRSGHDQWRFVFCGISGDDDGGNGGWDWSIDILGNGDTVAELRACGWACCTLSCFDGLFVFADGFLVFGFRFFTESAPVFCGSVL
jgi:hypothetical protein